MATFRYYIGVFLLIPVVILRIYLSCDGNYKECASSLGNNSPVFGVFSIARVRISDKIHRKLPSPHAEILLGMTTGIDEFEHLPLFYEILCDVGTIHVVVVSGFNITLVFSLMEKILGTLYKLRNLIISQLLVAVYALFSGFDPPVIRALIMSSIVYWGRYYGRNLGALRVLLFSAQLMLLVDPRFVFSLSFQLSFLSTLGLVLFSTWFGQVSKKLFGQEIDDLISTLAAMVLVWPLVSLKFGRVSLVSPLVNLLVLWTIPIATVLGTFMIMIEMLVEIPYLLWYPVFFLIDIFVKVCRYFESIPLASIYLQLRTSHALMYYICILVFVLRKNDKPWKKS